jgi:hypothetical protein
MITSSNYFILIFLEARKIFQETNIIFNTLSYGCLSADNINKDTDKGIHIPYMMTLE